jgi:hypothetical protein
MTLPPPPSPEEKSSKNINLFERLKENSVFDISPISNPPSSQEIFGQYQIIPKISPSTPQEEEKKEIWIRIYLISRRWFLLRLVFIGGFSLAVFLLYQGIPLFLDLELFPLVQQRHLHYSLWLGFSLYLISFYAIPLFRRKYLVVFPPQGRLGFFGSFFGPRKYSFSEVANIEFEVDMTHTLKELQAFELCRIYLRLVNRKLLLVTEGLGQKKMADLAEFLADHLKVVVHPFHRIGIKRYTEISLGRYKVLEELSHGGMGKVFLARDQENDR